MADTIITNTATLEGSPTPVRTTVTKGDVAGVSTGVTVTTAGVKYYSEDDVAAIAERLVQQRLADVNAINQSTLLTTAKGIAKQIVDETAARQKLADQLAKNGRVMTRFAVDDVVSNVKTKVSTAMWTGNDAFLATYFTSSDQSLSSRQYYIGVYNTISSSLDSELQFSIAYGHRQGSGSLMTNGDSPSMAIYYQYRNILLNPGDTQFTLGDSRNTDSIYVLSIARNRLKDKLDPGNWELTVSSSTKTVHLIDDSNSNTSYSINAAGRIFNIVSGTIYQKTTAELYSPKTYYGLVYPDMGILVLDADMLVASGGIVVTSSINTSAYEAATSASLNCMALFNSFVAAGKAGDGTSFAARNEETITSTHYFVRVKNGEYNYSNNPTFATGSLGDLRYIDFIDNPNVYITTVGLYNDRNELLAVAKLSRPLLKNFDTESLIKVRLDF